MLGAERTAGGCCASRRHAACLGAFPGREDLLAAAVGPLRFAALVRAEFLMANAQVIADLHVESKLAANTLPVAVIIPTRNEAANLPRCLASLGRCAEVYVIDSNSTDATVDIARSFGAKVVQFDYRGGWPKKRQWALDTLN